MSDMSNAYIVLLNMYDELDIHANHIFVNTNNKHKIISLKLLSRINALIPSSSGYFIFATKHL